MKLIVSQLEEMVTKCLRICSIPSLFFLWFLLYPSVVTHAEDDRHTNIIKTSTTSMVSRGDFPPGFVFGAGTSAYQIEGAAGEDGRKPSIWDTFAHAGGGRVADDSNGDIAADQYHKYKEDVKLMHKIGLDAYRFSISWSRLIPDGHGYVNAKGLEYYNNLIDELVTYGIEAHVTLSHFDIPQALQDEYEGTLSSKFIEDFTAYADLCFEEYGDRVKSWITFNEPNIQTITGNDIGIGPPGRCSYPFGLNCSKGDSRTEPYLAAHNILLSHVEAVNLYRAKYQEKQGGHIGITLLALWFEPMTDLPQDVAATQRARDFYFGWFVEPLVYGNYPATMRNIVGSRLPSFTKNEMKQLKGAFDFIGLNYYGFLYVQNSTRTPAKFSSDYIQDVSVSFNFGLGKTSDSGQDFTKLKSDAVVDPSGLERLMEYIKLKYRNPPVAIHENGYLSRVDDSSYPTARNDIERIEYLQSCVQSLLQSVRNGSNVKGYFMWSFIDCFELSSGYTTHYGLFGVDFNDKDRKRYARQSAHWYSTFLEKKTGTPSYFYSV